MSAILQGEGPAYFSHVSTAQWIFLALYIGMFVVWQSSTLFTVGWLHRLTRSMHNPAIHGYDSEGCVKNTIWRVDRFCVSALSQMYCVGFSLLTHPMRIGTSAMFTHFSYL